MLPSNGSRVALVVRVLLGTARRCNVFSSPVNRRGGKKVRTYGLLKIASRCAALQHAHTPACIAPPPEEDAIGFLRMRPSRPMPLRSRPLRAEAL